MADNRNNIRGAIETNQASADTMLASLPGKVVSHGKHAVAGVLAGLAIAVSNPAIAQTTPASPSTSASATADKGLGVGQYTQDGREFAKLSDEEVGKLNVREKIAYKKWSIESEKQRTINELKGLKQDEAQLIVEYQRMIDNFSQLHAKKSTAPIYFTIKEDLKKVLLAGKPPELLPQLESIRSILMS